MECKNKVLSGVKVIALVSAVCAAAALASCASSNTTPDASNALLASGATEGSYGVFNTEEQVELTVWESHSGPDEFIKQAGAKYHEMHPNVTIKYVNVQLGDSSSKIALDGPAGFGADLFAAPADSLGKLASGGHILPTVDPYGVKARVLGSCSKALMYNGKMYGYPISAETYALFYNRAYVSDDDVPTTWEGLKTWVADFNAANPGKRGFVMEVGSGYYTIVFTTLNGNRLFGESGTDTSSTYLNTADSVEGMKFFQSFREILNVPAADLQTGICDGAFQAGEAAMCINEPWNLKPFKEAGLDFGVAPLPSLPGESTPSASFSGTRAMFVSAYTDYPEETAEFARFLISEDMQRLRFDITGVVPSIRVDVSSPYIGGFLEQLEYAFPMPSAPQMDSFWMAFGSASANIWNGSNVQRELDACDKTIFAQSNANAALWDAAQSGTAADVRAAIKAGADVNARYGLGITPLMLAASNNTNLDVTKALIAAGADVNARDGLGITPLMYAASGNTNPDVVKALIAAGANVNARDEYGWTPLMEAAGHNTNPDVLKALIAAGADKNARDSDGLRAIDWLGTREDKDTFYGTDAYWAMRDLLY